MKKVLQYIINIPKFIFDKYVFIINWTKQWHICHYLVWATFPVLAYLLYACVVSQIWNSNNINPYAGLAIAYMLFFTWFIIYALIVCIFPITLLIYLIFYLRKKNFKIKNKFLLYNPIYNIFYNVMSWYIILVLIYIIYGFIT